MSEFDAESDTIEQTYTHPLILEGYEVVYDQNVIVRVDDDKDQTFNFKIAQAQNEDGSGEIRVEMTIENDIYYLEEFLMDSETYKEWIKHQKYRKCKFENFAEHLSTILENARTNRSSYNVKFVNETLGVYQRLEFKTVELFKIDFHEQDRDDQYTHDQAQYRYHHKISDYNDKKNELRKLLDFVSKKNPTLGTQLKRSVKSDI